MAKCYRCGDGSDFTHRCNYCNNVYCGSHRLPEKHNCVNLEDIKSPTTRDVKGKSVKIDYSNRDEARLRKLLRKLPNQIDSVSKEKDTIIIGKPTAKDKIRLFVSIFITSIVIIGSLTSISFWVMGGYPMLNAVQLVYAIFSVSVLTSVGLYLWQIRKWISSSPVQ